MNLIYRESVVAYVDMLGFKDILRFEDKARDLLDLMKQLQVNTSPKSEIICTQTGISQYNVNVKPAINMFSDSMIMSVSDRGFPGVANWGHCILAILSRLSELACYLIVETGLLLRGGIAFGKLYHEDGIFFGQGLVDAYNLEMKKNGTKYPAVRVHEDVVRLFGQQHSSGKEPGFFLHEDDVNFYIDIFSRHAAIIMKPAGSFMLKSALISTHTF